MTAIIPHGTLDYAEVAALGLTPEDLIVFSSNINPYGPPDDVIAAVRNAATRAVISRYPDRLSLELRDLLADHLAVSPTSILVGNGTADIMWLIGILFTRGKRVAILSPTFGEYENVTTLWEDATVHKVPFHGWRKDNEGNFAPADTTLADCAAALQAVAPDLVFICNPNNPTGQLLSPQMFQQLHHAAPGALWIVDEAYGEFVEESWSAVQWVERGNLIVLRSMTKDFSLGGLRLGYAVAAPSIIDQLQQTQPPWNVNALAQVAGVAAMHAQEWRKSSLATLRQDCARLRAALQKIGYAPLPTTTSYFLLPAGNAAQTRAYLLRERLMVRDCSSFGLPHHIRIATQRPQENELLVQALNRYRGETTA